MMKGYTLSDGGNIADLSYHGIVTFGCLIFLILIGLLAYVGFTVGEACWNYLEMRQKSREALVWAVAGLPKIEGDIVRKVIVNARQIGVELNYENVKIVQTADILSITVSWKKDVVFPYYTLPLKFSITLTDEKRWNKGALILKPKFYGSLKLLTWGEPVFPS